MQGIRAGGAVEAGPYVQQRTLVQLHVGQSGGRRAGLGRDTLQVAVEMAQARTQRK